MDASDGGARRKRKSRFSDSAAAEPPLKKRTPAEIAAAAAAALASVAATSRAATTRSADPAALAKAAAAKISRVIPGGAAPAAATGAVVTAGGHPADASEQLRLAQERRQRTDQIYKSVQDQMSHIRALLRKPGETGKETFMPAPLLLDDQGRQVDAEGKVIADKPTITANAGRPTDRGSSHQAAAPRGNQNPYLSHRAVDKDDKLDAVDPRLRTSKRETYVNDCFVS